MDKEDITLLDNKARNNKGNGRNYVIVIALIVLALVLLVVAVVFIALYANMASKSSSSASVGGTCDSSACVNLASEILSSMDESKSPCQDFYGFACGGWEAKNTIPEGSGRWSSFGQLDHLNTITISRLLADINSSEQSTAVKKTGFFYASCLNTTAVEARGAQPLIDILQSVGGWKVANISGSGEPWNISQLAQLQSKGSSAFLDFYVYADAKNSTKQAIYLAQSGITLQVPSFYNSSTFKEAYITLMTEVVSDLGGTDKETVKMNMTRVFELEYALSQIFYSRVQLRNISLVYNPMPIANITAQYPFLDGFDWLQYFKQSFKEAGLEDQITNETVVIVETQDYFKDLPSQLSDFKEDEVENYVKWLLVYKYLPLLDSRLKGLYDSFNTLLTGNGAKPRYETCTAIVTSRMQYTVSRLYTQSNIQGGTRNKMNAMIDAVEESFKARLKTRGWLDAETEKRCEEKVDAISRLIAYPSYVNNITYLDTYYATMDVNDSNGYFENSVAASRFIVIDRLKQYGKPTDKTRWELPPTAVNAYYSPSFNQFVFLEGILHPPFFDPLWPDYFLYGAMGVVIGHELSHGFDDQGQKYNADGNYVQWWSQASEEAFKKRTTCYVDQYGNYSINDNKVNGELTLGENIADNGGLITSYQAYKSTPGGDNQALPGIGQKYTSDQLFFLAFGQAWCTLYTPAYLASSVKTDPHSPGPIRVLGTLSNSKEFSEAFSCSTTSRYNPSNKCELW